MKTNAMRILESLGIDYKVHTYEFDEDHLDAVHAADSAGLPAERVYKTIVLQNTAKETFVFCLPAGAEISMKKARALTGSKDIDLIKMKDLQPLTGYIRGGCSPLGMKRHFPTFIEEMASLEDTIFVSAGQRGLQLEVEPEALRRAAGALFADFT